jgi:pimeloyl-ACP methyl ester carboxylesterase
MRKTKGLEYEHHGEGDPVLLIHGSHVADAFLPLVREEVLADHYHLIRYHRRGFAGSDRHTGPFSIEEQAQDALAMLDELEIERAHFVGHSYGAVIALQLACETPSAVHSLALLEPPKTTEELEGFELLEPIIAKYRAGHTSEAAASFMALVWGPDWRAEVERTVPGGPEQAEADAATYFDVELPALGTWILDKEKARQISQPILYVIGSESGPVFDRPMQAFQAAVPQSEERVLPELNHLLQIRNPRLVAGLIASFLAQHPL